MKCDLPTGSLPNTTVDKFLGGRFEVIQPRKGRHRSGLDAVLLAAAVPNDAKGVLFDLGAGAGVAGMAVAIRIPHISAVLVERDRFMCDLARESLNLKINSDLAGRVSVTVADVTEKGSLRDQAGLKGNSANHVIMNPPYYQATRVSPSPHSDRSNAHILSEGGIEPWVRTAADLLISNGTLTVIFHAEFLPDLLSAMYRRFGAITIVPILPRIGEAATRVIVQGTLGSRAPVEIRGGFPLHQATGRKYLPETDAILRHGQGLDLKSI